MTETRRISKRLINFVLVLMIRELLTGYEPHSLRYHETQRNFRKLSAMTLKH